MSEATCSNCRHWEADSDHPYGRTGFGECTVARSSGMRSGAACFYATSRSGEGSLLTTAEFGCVAFEPRERE